MNEFKFTSELGALPFSRAKVTFLNHYQKTTLINF